MQKSLDFNDYNNYPNEENPTTDGDMQNYLGNQNIILTEVANNYLWQPNVQMKIGQIIRSTNMPDGLHAVVRIAGITGNSEPEWLTEDSIVTDGNVSYEMKKQYFEVRKTDIINMVYPVGSIYISTVSTNPNTLFGVGTWARIGEGKCLIDAGNTFTAGSSGGNASITLTTAQLPSHSHANTVKITNAGSQAGSHNHYSGVLNDASGKSGVTYEGTSGSVNYEKIASEGYLGSGTKYRGITSSTNPASHSHNNTVSITNANTGSGNSINIRNPYLAVYMWKRTA